jgi:predicted ribonuclease YlaK
VVPVLVVEELDELEQRGRDRARDPARSVLRRLWELNSGGKQAADIPGARPVTVEVLADDSWHVRRPVNDNEIIERALFVSEIIGGGVILAAGDYSMLYQASPSGLKTA